MKIIRILFIVFLSALFLTGCFSKKEKQFQNEDIELSTTAIFQTDLHVNNKISKIQEPLSPEDIKIVDSILTNNSETGVQVTVKYPQLIDHTNLQIQNKINKRIYKDIILSYDLVEWQNESLKAEVEYEIMFRNETFISILFTGYITNGFYHDFVHTMTFDLQTGELLKISEFFEKKDIIDYIDDTKTKKYMITPEEFDTEETKKLFLESLNNFDNHTNDFYLESNMLILITSLAPFNDHAFLEISLGDTFPYRNYN